MYEVNGMGLGLFSDRCLCAARAVTRGTRYEPTPGCYEPTQLPFSWFAKRFNGIEVSWFRPSPIRVVVP